MLLLSPAPLNGLKSSIVNYFILDGVITLMPDSEWNVLNVCGERTAFREHLQNGLISLCLQFMDKTFKRDNSHARVKYNA